MSTTSIATAPLLRGRPRVLADALPRKRVVDATLVLAGAGLTTLAAQISIHVPPSPVPVTGQTLAVIVAGASLGARRGASSQLLYLLLGLLLPVYADGEQGWHVVWGSSGGYLVGFVLAAFAVGFLAERGADRRPVLAIATFATGQLLVFGVGVPWLKVAAQMSWGDAIHYGFTVFIVGGVIKAIVAGVATPLAWRSVGRLDGKA